MYVSVPHHAGSHIADDRWAPSICKHVANCRRLGTSGPLAAEGVGLHRPPDPPAPLYHHSVRRCTALRRCCTWCTAMLMYIPKGRRVRTEDSLASVQLWAGGPGRRLYRLSLPVALLLTLRPVRLPVLDFVDLDLPVSGRVSTMRLTSPSTSW